MRGLHIDSANLANPAIQLRPAVLKNIFTHLMHLAADKGPYEAR